MKRVQWKYPTRTPTYNSWIHMHARCYDPRQDAYEHYGGRGITVCIRWHSYDAFYEDMGERPEGMTLHRIDNDKGYEPDNCRWATSKEQRRTNVANVMLTFNGKTQCAADWADELGLNRHTIKSRLIRGASIERAFRKVGDP